MNTTRRPTAIVTGGGQGVGLAVVDRLLAGEMNVVACDLVTPPSRDSDRLVFVEADLTDPDVPQTLVDRALGEFAGVDTLVNNAARIGDETPFEAVDDETWSASLAVNLMAAVRCTRAAVAPMIAAGSGNIVMIGSDAGELPEPMFAPYSVAKAGMLNLSKVVSKAYGSAGVRCNYLSLGLTRTHATAGLLDSLREEHGSEEAGIAHFTASMGMALPRIGEAGEVADLVAFLIGPGGRQITGAAIRVDGGTMPGI